MRSWAVMVQREVADRWAAPVGSALYGAPAVLLALTARQRFMRAVPPTVFMPRPRVESAFVVWERTGPAPPDETRALVQAAFAQRRKTLVNALGSAGWERAAVAAALRDLGLDERVRAQELAPTDLRALAERLDPVA